MTLTEVIRAAGVITAFRRPCHAIPSYYNGHVKDFHQRTRMAMLSLDDLEATDWMLCNEPLFTQAATRFIKAQVSPDATRNDS